MAENESTIRAGLLLDAMKFAYRVGENQTAVQLANRAVTVASEDSEQAQARLVQTVLAACESAELLQAGSFRKALDCSDLDPPDKIWGFLTLARCAGKQRQGDLASALFDDAETAAHQLARWDRASALLQVAEAAMAADDVRRARRLIGVAVPGTQSLVAQAYAAEVTSEAARLAAELGDSDRARALLGLAEKHIRPDDRIADSCAVGVAAAKCGDRTRALRLLRESFDAAMTNLAAAFLMADAAQAAARAGEIDLATRWLHMAEAKGREETASVERLKWAGAFALSRLPPVAEAAARAGQIDAVLLLAQASAELSQWNVVIGVATGLARAGAIRQAQTATELLPGRGDIRDRATAEIADAAAAAGDWPLARSMAAQISGWTLKNGTLAAIGHAAADQGKWQVAEQAAHDIDDSPGHRISVLADAAKAAMKRGQKTAARRILRELPNGWPRLRATLEATQAVQRDPGDTGHAALIERALAVALHDKSGLDERRDRVHNLISLVRATSNTRADTVLPQLLGALVDAVRNVDSTTSRTFDACDAADAAGAAGHADVTSTLLTIAEKAAIQSNRSDKYRSTRIASVIRAAARHGDDDRVDRLLPLLAAETENGSCESAAQTAAYAARFDYADHVISGAPPWHRQSALRAAIRGALDAAPHRSDPIRRAEARKQALRWLIAALRIDLEPELAALAVTICPDVAPLVLSWFEPTPPRSVESPHVE